MHWEFCNGTWAAKHEGKMWGIQAAKDGKFLVINPEGDVCDSAYSLSSAQSAAERLHRRMVYSGSEMESMAKAFVANMTAEQFQAFQLFSADVAFTLCMELVLRNSREGTIVAEVLGVSNE